MGKNKLLFGIVIVSLLLLTGCMVYGEGTYTGNIISVEEGIFWNVVWLKTTVESSDADCFLLLKNDPVSKTNLEHLSTTQTKVTIKYLRHLITLTQCDNSDEIIDFNEVK